MLGVSWDVMRKWRFMTKAILQHRHNVFYLPRYRMLIYSERLQGEGFMIKS